jgi:RimJ/RimL family protein N-acetyltransferase
MHLLKPEQYDRAQKIFEPLSTFNASLASLLSNTATGEVWVDDPDQPQVGYASSPESQYLAGDAGCTEAYAGLRQVIPNDAYLITSAGWDAVLEQVWQNRFARRHARCHLLLAEPKFPQWRDHLPAGMHLAQITPDLLQRDELKNIGSIRMWVGSWPSQQAFFEHGFGFCLLDGDTIACWSVTDCAVGDRCEIGIITDRAYRKRGLAAVVVAAAVEHALQRGYREIGWQCLASNAGSLALGYKTGFVFERQYDAYAPFMAVENPTDLTPDEYAQWAQHFDRAAQEEAPYAFEAAKAWAMAGEPERALRSLNLLQSSGWKGERDWFERSWCFDSMRSMPEFEQVVEMLIKRDS